jgi:hypothetical protein
MSSTERMRRLRARRSQDDSRVYPVEVGSQALAFLVARGLLDHGSVGDATAVGRALERALTEWAEYS